jgi:hypothetical protein
VKLFAQHDKSVNILTLSSVENCDTDSWPIVPDIQFRHFRGAPDAEFAAIAGAILFASHCGSVIEFANARLSIDSARVVRRMVPHLEELAPINGAKRDISQGTLTLIVGEAGRVLRGGIVPANFGQSARMVTWSGDFVGVDKCNSTSHVGGEIFTNAGLVTNGTAISVALALLVGGRTLREIYVPATPEAEREGWERLREGLEFIGIKARTLETVPNSARRVA